MNSHGKSFAISCRNTCNVVVAPDELGKGIRDGTSGVTLENRDSSVKYIMAIQKRTARKDKSTDAPANSRCIGLADNDEMDVAAYRKGWEMETASKQVGGGCRQDARHKPCRRISMSCSVALFNQRVAINANCGFGGDGRPAGNCACGSHIQDSYGIKMADTARTAYLLRHRDGLVRPSAG